MSNLRAESLSKTRDWQRVGLTVISLVFLITAGYSAVAIAAEKGPIRIGHLSPLTGSRALVGADMETGFKMYLNEINYTVAGRKIEFIGEDEGTPSTAVPKARKLIQHDKVDAIAGLFMSSIAYAVAPLCNEANIALVLTATAGDDLTQRSRTKNIIRVNFSGSQVGHVAGDYAYRKLGWRRVAIIAYEHAFGQETVGAFQRVFEEAGGKVIQRIYTPRETLDFSPYVTNLKRDADGLFAVITDTPFMRVMKALQARGLLEKWKILNVLTATDESFLQEMGDPAIGVLTVNSYSPVIDTPENKKFIEKARKSTTRVITGTMMDSYVAAEWIVKAIKTVSGDVENRDKFMQALQNIEIADTPHGPLKLDKYGNAITNIYIRRVDKANNLLQNTIIETYPNVSQFWKYNPETYLKEPLYSRDNPPCRYCE
jgi:branched-chain amino acid transport system substrate-binding protein